MHGAAASVSPENELLIKCIGGVAESTAAECFDALPLDRKRAVIDVVCQVTIEPIQSPGERFNPERIRIERGGAQ